MIAIQPQFDTYVRYGASINFRLTLVMVYEKNLKWIEVYPMWNEIYLMYYNRLPWYKATSSCPVSDSTIKEALWMCNRPIYANFLLFTQCCIYRTELPCLVSFVNIRGFDWFLMYRGATSWCVCEGLNSVLVIWELIYTSKQSPHSFLVGL